MCKHGLGMETECYVCNGRQAMVRRHAVKILEGMSLQGIFTGKEMKAPREGSDLDLLILAATRQESKATPY